MTETGMVDVAGLGIRCRVDAQGSNAPWVVFSNSLGTALEVWDAQAAALSPRFRILRYDQRGHGGSGVPAEPCDFRRLGADLLALLDRFDIRRCCLRSEEHTSELQSLMRISYAVFCLKKKTTHHS